MLSLSLFQSFSATLHGQPLTSFYSVKARALLVYLALAEGRRVRRGEMAGLLWPDHSETRARRNLSQTMTSLRKLWPDVDFMGADTQTLWLEPAVGIEVDVWALRRLLAEVEAHEHVGVEQCVACTGRLTQATALYTGPFLHTFASGTSDLFEQWVETQRENLFQQALAAFQQLSDSLEQQNNLSAAISITRRILELAPWQESSHRQLMRLLAYSDQRIQALNQYEILGNILMAELGVSPSAESDALYDQILAGELTPPVSSGNVPTPPPPDRSAPPFLAPQRPTHFVGRDGVLTTVADQLKTQSDQTTAVALIGMGGSGKTSLAIMLAYQLREFFSDGVLWGNTATSDSINILDLWGRAYDHDFSGLTDLASRAGAVRNMLSDKRTLVIIDNVDDAADARPLIPNGPNCAIIYTTRNADIASALNAEPILLTELTPENSLQLLVAILGEERVTNRPEEATAATRIGELLHHLPLAVEIAAQRLKSRPRMKLTALAQRLEDTKGRLGLNISDQAVRTSFEVSWEALDEELRLAFGALAGFGGRSFTVEALAATLEQDEFDVEDQLYTLVALSLLQEAGAERYKQHPLLADFAVEKMPADSPWQANAIHHFLDFAKENRDDVSSLESEWENLLAAVKDSFTEEMWESVLGFTEALAERWFLTGRFTDGLTAYQLAQQAATHLDNNHELAQNLLRQAQMAVRQSDRETARPILERAQKLFLEAEYGPGIAKTQYYQGNLLYEEGLYGQAEKQLRSAKQIHNSLGDAREEAITNVMLAWVRIDNGLDLEVAKALGYEALSLIAQLIDQPRRSAILRVLATVAIHEQRLDDANDLIDEALALAKATKDTVNQGFCYYLIVVINSMRQAYERAIQLGFEGQKLYDQIGDRRMGAMVRHEMGVVYFKMGDLETSTEITKQNLLTFQAIEDRVNYGFSLRLQGDIAAAKGDVETSLASWLEAKQLAEYLNHPVMLAQIKRRLADQPPQRPNSTQ